MTWLMDHPEQYLYRGTYQQFKGIRIRHAEELSTCFVLAGLGQSGVAYVNTRAYEFATGVMRRFGHQWLARDSLEELERFKPNPGTKEGYEHHFLKPIRCEYYFDSFIIFTKSNFDFIAHLINEVLKLGRQGKHVDLARKEFRTKISKASPHLGATIDRYAPWMIEVTKYRKAIEHQKVLPLTYFDLDELRRTHFGLYRTTRTEPVLRFPETPITFWEAVFRKRTYRTRPVLPYLDSSLRKTKEIIEKAFEVASSVLQESKPVVEYRQARERVIRSSYESVDPVKFRALGEFTAESLKQYLAWKFPKRELGRIDASVESGLSKELRDAEIVTYRDLDKTIDKKMEWLLDYERTHPMFQSLDWDSITQTYPSAKKADYDSTWIMRTIIQDVMRTKRVAQKPKQSRY